ncbi:MAG: NYN domain-containing protein [Alphaproteobacteria bacterium]|nr:NYN domain-containing protein [Alphaproteobacteria bacterium]MDA8003347.1 NYN domain-containing protein [Alphaproteobacteria bacterium]MDA8005319.1 NYN domain-containing protein [Alphaproteobacteria bacterium]MDA8012732.1 NYN domain-containing protein [Alphaproteobacteria bacterium]
MTSKVFAILIDGGFLSKRFVAIKRGSGGPVSGISSGDVKNFIDHLCAWPDFKDSRLLRAYYYDAYPSEKTLRLPVSGDPDDLSKRPAAVRGRKFLGEIQAMDNVAFREGTLMGRGWILRKDAVDRLVQQSSAGVAGPLLGDKDFMPNLQQKGVDMRVGLDIARLSMGRMVDSIIVVAADSDFVPALKFARREGVRVYLNHLGGFVSRDAGILVHSDVVMGRDLKFDEWSRWFNPLQF